MNKFEYYKERHYVELSGLDSVSGRAQGGGVGLIFLLTLALYMIMVFDYNIATPAITAVFWVLITLFFVITAGSGLCFFLAFWGNEYRTVIPPNELEEYSEQYKNYLLGEGYIEEIAVKKTEKEEFDLVLSQLIECCSQNAYVNIKRSQLIHRGFALLSLSSVFLLFCGTPFVLYDLDASSPRKAFEIKANSLTSLEKMITKHTLIIGREDDGQ